VRHKRIRNAVDCSFQAKFVVGVTKVWPLLGKLKMDDQRVWSKEVEFG
jgi:hypothetical protein